MRTARFAVRLFSSVALASLPASAIGLSSSVARADDEAPKAPTLTKAPKLVKFVEAPFPESEKASGKGATVVLQIAISATGSVQEVVVVGPASPAFDKAALEAVRQFVFEPAEFDHKPSPVKITYKYEFVFKEEKVHVPTVNFTGIVRDKLSKKPLAGVSIVVDDLPAQKTDKDGRFSYIDLPEGKHSVTISGDKLTTVTTEETIEKEKKLEVKYSVEEQEELEPGEEAPDMVMVIVAPKVVKEAVSVEIKTEEGRRVPGTQGDTLKVVQNLPGVARAAAGSGALVVWGAAPNDTRVYVDGVRVPLLYHLGGLRSTVNGDLVRAIELAPGGYGAEYGRGLGGIVTVDTRSLRGDKFHGYVAGDLIDASAMVETPLGPETRVAVAARKSYLDSTLSLFTKDDVNDLFPISQFWDAQLKIERDLRANETIGALVLASSDSLTRTVPNDDPAQVKSQNQTVSFVRGIALYRRQLEDGSTVVFTPSVGRDHSSLVSRFGGTPTELTTDTTAYGLRASWRGRVASTLVVSTGVDFEANASDIKRTGAATLPAREGDITVFGQPPPDNVNSDTWSTFLGSIAPYAQVDWGLLADKLHIVPGVRLEAFLTTGSSIAPPQLGQPATGFSHEETVLEPRLSARWQATPKLSIKAAAGLYHQAPQPEDLSAVFGNPKLGLSKATQVLAGASYKVFDKLTAEITAFLSQSDSLVSRSASSTPALAQALVQDGQGRAYGAQILIRRELAQGFFGWASYALIRSERRDHYNPDNPNDPTNTSWRLFDYDQTHVLTVVASYDLGKGWEVGARFRYASGFPRTPVLGAFYDARRDLYEPYFGQQNSTRIPAFVAVDLRAAKRFQLGEQSKLEVFLDVQNATNQQNREDIVYNYNYSQRAYINGLPILPVLGARLEW